MIINRAIGFQEKKEQSNDRKFGDDLKYDFSNRSPLPLERRPEILGLNYF